MNEFDLTPRATPGALVTHAGSGWRMEIPAGARGTYRLAQVDDYSRRPRRFFPHAPPLTVSLRARVSASSLPGTWGFGLWNDPFGLSLGFGGSPVRLPALPQAAWFFYGSPENSLSFQDTAPASGFFAGTFVSPRLPSLVLAPAVLALPLLTIRPLSRCLHRLAGKLIHQDGAPVHENVSSWHAYQIEWRSSLCRFCVDDIPVLETSLAPSAPLGLVIWIDNQYAAWGPDRRPGYGTLANPEACLEIASLSVC
jgi:hypothetical protein